MYILSRLIVILSQGQTNDGPSGKCSELESTKDYRPESKRTVVFRLTNDS